MKWLLATALSVHPPTHKCAHRLFQLAKRPAQDYKEFYSHSINKQPEFLSWLLAIGYVESRFNPDALSKSRAYGIMQVTPVGSIEAAAECLIPSIKPERLFHAPTNILYSSCLLRKYLRDARGDWVSALILYNGGYVQLEKRLAGLPIAPETEEYVLRVLNAHHLCLEP